MGQCRRQQRSSIIDGVNVLKMRAVLVCTWSDLGWYFADIVVYPRCAFNEFQKQDEMKDNKYTNLQLRVLTKNQITKRSTQE